MQDMQRTNRANARAFSTTLRRLLAPVMAVTALTLTTTTAMAFTGASQAKPQLNVEAERTPQGARLTFKGKGWAPSARIKITGSRAPGSNGAQDFGTFSADSTGVLAGRKVAACSTTNMEDGQNEQVTITAADSATGVKVVQRVQGGAWVCQ